MKNPKEVNDNKRDLQTMKDESDGDTIHQNLEKEMEEFKMKVQWRPFTPQNYYN